MRNLLCILVVMLLLQATMLPQTPASVPTPTDKTASAETAPPPVEGFVLRDGTPLRLRTARNLTSANAQTDETIDFEVLEDVVVDGKLVIAKGSSAIGTVTHAQKKRRLGRGGKLDVMIEFARLTTGDKVALRASQARQGGGHAGAMTGAIVATSIVFFPAAPLFLLMHGKDIEIPKGTAVSAYVNGDMKLNPEKYKPAEGH